MRNAIERAWAQIFMNLVRFSNRKIEEVPDSECYAHFRDTCSPQRGDYLTVLDNWLAVFPKEPLYVNVFEDIVERPKQLLADIFMHINVSCDIDWSPLPYYQGVDVPVPEKYRKDLECAELEYLYERLGERINGQPCTSNRSR